MRADQLGAGVEQHEVAGAVGVLGLAGREADLADGGGLLVAEVAGERHLAAERTVRRASCRSRSGYERRPDLAAASSAGCRRTPSSSSSQSRVSRSISMVRLALVTSVTCTPPSRPPVRFQSSQVSVLPKIASPRLGGLAHAVDVLQDPLDLAAGEVRRRRQPGLAPDDVAAPVALERGGDPVGAGVLPDDRVVVGPAGPPVPHDRGLALVGDAERGEVGGLQAGLRRARSGSPRCVRSQISIGLCSTQPACGRICSCSSWWRATSLPPWSKIMNRVLVVPWSIGADEVSHGGLLSVV